MKVVEQQEARRLRAEEGESIRSIAQRLGVSPSSVSVWVRDVPLSASQRVALAERNPAYNGQCKGQQTIARRARERRRAWQQERRALARRKVPLHLAGCMLYWAEGTKHHQRLCFSNSDVRMMRLFVRFLRECLAVRDEPLRFSVNCYLGNGLSLDEIEVSWLEALELPRACLLRATVNRPSPASREKRRTLLYGTGRLVVHSTAIAQQVYGAIQEYGGFDDPSWLG